MAVLNDELRVRLERELSTGAALPVVCQRTGVKPRSLERWLRDGKVVRRRIECLHAPATAAELAEPELVGAISAAAERGCWHAAAWLLERRWPERWAKPSHAIWEAGSQDAGSVRRHHRHQQASSVV